MNIVEKHSRICKKMKCNEYIASALLAVIPRIIMVITTAYPLRVTGDELFMFYLPAKLAGLDWSGSMERYRYYGYGFTIFLVPLFKWISNPVILYRVVLCIVSMLQAVISVLCCYLLRNFYKSYHPVTNTVISVIISYMVSVYATYMYNEHIYIICVWISFFIFHLLMKTHNDKKRKLLYSVGLGISFVFSLTIHQRAVTLVYAFLITYIVYFLMFRKVLAYASIVMAIFGSGYLVNQKIVAWNVKYLSSATPQVEEVQNTSVNTSFSLDWFQNKDYVQAFVRTIVGNFNLLNLRTLGLWILTIVVVIYLLYKYSQGKISRDEKDLGILACFSIACIGITMFGLATTWGWGIMQAYVDNDASADALRGLRYFRYYICYYTPIIPGFIIYIKNNKSVCIKLFKYALVASILCLSYYVKKIVAPLLINSEVGLVLKAFSFVTFETEEISIRNYMLSILIIIIIVMMMIVAYKCRSINCVLALFMSFVVVQYIYDVYIGDGRAEIYNREYSNAATQLIQELNEKEIDCSIYVQPYTIPKTNQNVMYELQFMNMQNALLEGLPTPNDDYAVGIVYYFSKESNEKLLANGYVVYQLDENEYAYIKGKKVLECMGDYTIVEQVGE